MHGGEEKAGERRAGGSGGEGGTLRDPPTLCATRLLMSFLQLGLQRAGRSGPLGDPRHLVRAGCLHSLSASGLLSDVLRVDTVSDA